MYHLIMNIVKKTMLAMALFILFFNMSSTEAFPLIVKPVVLDRKVKVRDILKESLIIKNISDRRMGIYICVNNISVDGGKQEFLDPSRADSGSSLANWIEVNRGVIELDPEEERKIDLTIGVNLRAEPGIYHAVISFPHGSTRAEAELRQSDADSVMFNLEIEDDAKEWLQLKKFISDKNFFWNWPISFSYILENTGNRALAHSGDVRIYDSSGREVAEIATDSRSGSILPENEKNFSLVWRQPETLPVGRYKAYLNLKYGDKQRGVLQDTVFFWVFPKNKLLILAGIVFSLVLLLILIKRFQKRKTAR